MRRARPGLSGRPLDDPNRRKIGPENAKIRNFRLFPAVFDFPAAIEDFSPTSFENLDVLGPGFQTPPQSPDSEPIWPSSGRFFLCLLVSDSVLIISLQPLTQITQDYLQCVRIAQAYPSNVVRSSRGPAILWYGRNTQNRLFPADFDFTSRD